LLFIFNIYLNSYIIYIIILLFNNNANLSWFNVYFIFIVYNKFVAYLGNVYILLMSYYLLVYIIGRYTYYYLLVLCKYVTLTVFIKFWWTVLWYWDLFEKKELYDLRLSLCFMDFYISRFLRVINRRILYNTSISS